MFIVPFLVYMNDLKRVLDQLRALPETQRDFFFRYIPSLGLYFLISPRLANAASAARDISANWP